eukprot:488319-Rhodomonas_salina.8
MEGDVQVSSEALSTRSAIVSLVLMHGLWYYSPPGTDTGGTGARLVLIRGYGPTRWYTTSNKYGIPPRTW